MSRPHPSVSIGAFFFRHRNWSFPLLIVACSAIAIPPGQTFGSERLEAAKDAVAILVAVAGLALRALVIGYQYVRRTGENRTIHAASLFTDGIFALCRNPLYTGNIMIVIAIFLMHGNPTVLMLGSAVFIFIYRAMVIAEESYLHATFGPDYDAYCARVPRWIPDLTRFGAATGGQPFSARRVLLVEYTNIAVTTIALTGAEAYEELAEPSSWARTTELRVLFGIVVAVLMWMVIVRVLKKRRVIVAP